MTELEKLIKDQRDMLNSEQPREGHEARFLKKLERPVRRVNFRHVLQVAASVAIILASAVVMVNQNKSGGKIAKEQIPAGILEADQYYASQVEARYNQIQAFEFGQEEEKAVLLDELNDLDAVYQQLMGDLEANPGDERVINALIRHYPLKLEIMDQIIYQLNQLKTITSDQDENENV
jgi:hypothetical protein